MARRLLGYRWRDEPLEVGWFLEEREKDGRPMLSYV
jgi:hypothetical protein